MCYRNNLPLVGKVIEKEKPLDLRAHNFVNVSIFKIQFRQPDQNDDLK